MMRQAVSLLLLIGAATGAAAAPRRAPAPTVVAVNNEPALRIGGTTLSRPFGADLVDRLAIVGSYRLHDETAYLIRGEAGTTCPARYLIASVKGRTAPVLTPAFGGCAPGATARVATGGLLVSVPGAPGVAPARFVYANGSVRPVANSGMASVQAESCAIVRAGAAALPVQQMLDETLSSYEARGAVLRHTDYSTDDLRGLVVDLACLATLPDGDRRVPRRAADLFASKRHGQAAFAALDQVARTPATGPDLRAAVRTFSAHMRYYVARRTVI